MERKRFVELQKFVTRTWQRFRLRSKYYAVNPESVRWKFPYCFACSVPDCHDRVSCSCSSRNVPQGFLAVYVGRERQRFVIPARYVNHPAFKLLLEKAKEEYGFSQKGGLTMPCEVLLFQRFLLLIGTDDPPSFELDICELEKYYLDKYHLCVERISMDD